MRLFDELVFGLVALQVLDKLVYIEIDMMPIHETRVIESLHNSQFQINGVKKKIRMMMEMLYFFDNGGYPSVMDD